MSEKVLFLDFDGVLHPTYSGSPKFTQAPLLERTLSSFKRKALRSGASTKQAEEFLVRFVQGALGKESSHG